MRSPVNLNEALASFDDVYSPRIVARMNDYDVRIAHTRGEHVWHVHEAEVRAHAPASISQRLALDARGGRHPRPVLVVDSHEDVLLVQHLVVLQAVKQCVRRRILRRRQEHGGSLHAVGWRAEQRGQERLERKRRFLEA